MHIIFSAAKKLNCVEASTQNWELSPDSMRLVFVLENLSDEELANVLDLKSEKALAKVKAYIESWHKGTTYTALDMYQGVAYRALEAETLDVAARNYLAKCLYILSALYGPISPQAQIKPYRLDFNSKLVLDGMSLRAFWQAKWDELLQKDELVINLASSEFASVLTASMYDWLDFDFYEKSDSKLHKSSTQLKQARGLCLRACALQNVTERDGFKQLEFADYHYEEALSTPNKFVYVRKRM